MSYISMKNNFVGAGSGTSTPAFTLPYVLSGSDGANNAIQTKLTNNYINLNTINPNNLTSGLTAQVLTTDSFGNVIWSNVPTSTYPVLDSIFSIANAVSGDILKFDASNVPSTGAIIKFSKNLNLPLSNSSSPYLFLQASDTTGDTVWADNHSDSLFYIFNSVDNSKIMSISLNNMSPSSHITLSFAKNLIFPTSDGVNGNLLQTNGSGLLSWVSSPSSFIDNIFNIKNSLDNTKILQFSNTNITTGTTALISFNKNLGFPSNNSTLGYLLTATDSLGNMTWSSPSFADNLFSVYNSVTPSKILAFNNVNLAPATTTNILFGTSLTFPVTAGALNTQNLMITNGSGTLSFAAPSFIDSAFSVFNATTNTKKLLFGCQNIATATSISVNFAQGMTWPLVSGTSGYALTTNGANPAVLSWSSIPNTVWPVNTTIFSVTDSTDVTKKFSLSLSGLTTATTSTLTMSPYNNSLINPLFNSMILYNSAVNQTTTLTTTVTAPGNSYTLALPPIIGTVGQQLQILSVAGSVATTQWVTPAASTGFGGNVARFTTPGNFTFTVPAGVTKLLVLVIGGGGGNSACVAGGVGQFVTSQTASAGGFIKKWITVSAGSVIQLTVGAAGAAGTVAVPLSNTNGGFSSFGSNAITGNYCYSQGGAANLTILATTSFAAGAGFDGTLQAGNVVDIGYGEASHPSFIYTPTSTGSCFTNIPSGASCYAFKAPLTSFSGSSGGSPGVNSDPTSFGCTGSPGLFYATTGTVISGNSTGGCVIIEY